jgi:hypothetical protein
MAQHALHLRCSSLLTIWHVLITWHLFLLALGIGAAVSFLALCAFLMLFLRLLSDIFDSASYVAGSPDLVVLSWLKQIAIGGCSQEIRLPS